MLGDSAILPLLTALVAGALAARMAGGAARAFAPAKPLWAIGLLLFAGASAAAAYGTADGWGDVSFRIYYLAGGCLCVAVLGCGSAFLALPRPLALVVLGMTLTAAVGATVTVLIAPVDTAALAAVTGLHAPPNAAIGGHASIWAIAMNAAGTVLLVAGAGARASASPAAVCALLNAVPAVSVAWLAAAAASGGAAASRRHTSCSVSTSLPGAAAAFRPRAK